MYVPTVWTTDHLFGAQLKIVWLNIPTYWELKRVESHLTFDPKICEQSPNSLVQGTNTKEYQTGGF